MLGALALGLAGRASAAPPMLADLERRLDGGRLGVVAVDLSTGRRISHRGHERFALCSTFKMPLVAAILAQVDAGRLRLDQTIPFRAADLLDHAPMVRPALAAGRITIAALCEGAVVLSDNAAANLLLRLVDGPAGLTRFMRAHDGAPTRLDRTEPTLNTNIPGDARDTTTPLAMVSLMRALLVRPGLSTVSRGRLIGWMRASTTGRARLRAGLPPAWRAGDKTGTGERGAANDILIAWPRPGHAPLLVASYVDAPDVEASVRDEVHRAVAASIVALVQ